MTGGKGKRILLCISAYFQLMIFQNRFNGKDKAEAYIAGQFYVFKVLSHFQETSKGKLNCLYFIGEMVHLS